MEISDFVKFEEKNTILVIVKEKKRYDIKSLEKMNLMIRTVHKDTTGTTMNSLANIDSTSETSGNEKVNLVLELSFTDGQEDEIQINKQLLVRFDLAYYTAVRFARELQDEIMLHIHQ